MSIQLVVQLIFSILVTILIIQPVSAEVWKCGKTYTSIPERHKNCIPIEGSKICGSEGNKYFAPRKMSGSTEAECAVTGRSKSPFVDLENYELNKGRSKANDAKKKIN